MPLVVKKFDPSALIFIWGILYQEIASISGFRASSSFFVGDFREELRPTGKSETRRQLTEEEVRQNAETYTQQISKILIYKKLSSNSIAVVEQEPC